MKQNLKGFTLIELMIVVVIIGILAAIVIPKFENVSESSRRAACRANMRTIACQEMIFFSMNSTFTTSMAELGMAGLVCPDGDSYLFAGMTTNIMSIQCPSASFHGEIEDGVASWRDHN